MADRADRPAVIDVLRLFAERGDRHDGEAVTQTAHALQTAEAARASGAADELVAAALLHDIGHLVRDAADGPVGDAEADDQHEAVGARWVAPRFGPGVARPIALHVLAKRYRCTVDPGYRAGLSPTSERTLQVQGGPLTGSEVAGFERTPGFGDAVLLRGWDEGGKVEATGATDIEGFRPLLESVARRWGRRAGRW
jgi:predicted HD phosphohydrolase